MSMLGEQIKELREKADMLDGLEGMDNLVRMLREAADTIEKLEPHSNQLEPSRWHELFGTPERAARTVARFSPLACSYCALEWESVCGDDLDKDCLLCDYNALLKWLEGDAEWRA